MKKFKVSGMSCAACSARVERAVSALEGVERCEVSLLTNSMTVYGSADEGDIISAVESAGYSAESESDGTGVGESLKAALEDTETPKIFKRFLCSLIFLAALMYISMFCVMWGFPIFEFMDEPFILALIECGLSAVILVINRRFFINGAKGLMHASPNMDTLVSMGSGVSFIYSLYLTVRICILTYRGDIAGAHGILHGLYFESAAMILALITLGKLLESRSKGKTTDALRGLIDLAPARAVLLIDGKEVEVGAEDVHVGDIFVVKAGESFPVDGVIIEGDGAVDESSLTGESIPVDKSAGDTVSAATVSRSGYLICRAERVGSETSLARIIKTVSDAASSKAPIAKVADRVSGIFVPAVMGIALLTFIIWLAVGRDIGYAVARGVSVLVISCPCALGLATPVAIMVGSGAGARGGILFKTAQSLEQTGRADIVILDKTGTITKGEPEVTDVIPYGMSENELLSVAYSLEKKSEHPLARAVVSHCEHLGVQASVSESFETLAGSGVVAVIDRERVCGGSIRFISETVGISQEQRESAEALAEQGKTPLLFSRGENIIGIIAVSDAVKPDSRRAISRLRRMGIMTVMLTGDNRRTADAVARVAEVDEVISDVLPEGKAAVVEKYKRLGNVIMVGDGINDAPALTCADIGMAIGAGTDIAIDAADVVLMRSTLDDVASGISLSRRVLINIKENLFWAFIYNIIGIPLAAGVWIPLTGWELSPMFGAAAMCLSSFCVVMNALRLNLFDMTDPAHDGRGHSRRKRKRCISGAGECDAEDTNTNKGKSDKCTECYTEGGESTAVGAADIENEANKSNNTNTEEIKMQNTVEIRMNIKGMMCCHCEARVKKYLEAHEGVISANVSHETGTAVIEASESVSDSELRDIICGLDYEVISIER